ncbi:Gfo/Idh/MocA family protein [Terriglobus roseus]|uniref:Predicted dehydrogenase n=1 Tax=Terriglobus roseus TaxID=392734 RepID=A0A1G7PRX2_9BACT|nr:Gfo/Idh/MocA family oxidoreductase [Terriglobus roseus]SDF89102.1 Predicted dehydrogenase [Terriglobus roseus]
MRSALRLLSLVLLTALAPSVRAQTASAGKPIRVAIVGLVHGHVSGTLNGFVTNPNPNVQLVAIEEPDTALTKKYVDRFHLESIPTYSDLETMLNKEKPDAILMYIRNSEHPKVAIAAAKHHVSSIMEKPMAISVPEALAMRKAAQQYNVHILTNYDTSYFPSNNAAIAMAQDGKLGTLHKMVFYAGHAGPLHSAPEFVAWLTDPEQNGAGALYDFGCYGADLVTFMLKGQMPISVTAVAQTDNEKNYPKVDDDATIIIRYPKFQAVLLPSWEWSFSSTRKDLELFGEEGQVKTVGHEDVSVQLKGDKTATQSAAPAVNPNRDSSLDYLVAVLRNQVDDHWLPGSLDTNMVAVQIMDAARESVKTGKTVELKPLP